MKNISDGEGWNSRNRHGHLDSAQTSRGYRTTVWQFGDRRNLKQTTSEFVKYSSLHGVHYIWSGAHSTSWVKLTVYRLLFAFCMLAVLVSIAFLVQESFSTESVYISSTSKEGKNGPIEDPLFPQHPRITLCRKPGYVVGVNESNQELLEYVFLSLGFPFTSLTPEERSLLVQIIAFRAKHEGLPLPEQMRPFSERMDRLKQSYDKLKESTQDFNLTQIILYHSVRCQDIFIRCIVFVFDLDCCDIFKPTLTSLGICYSVIVGEGRTKLLSSGVREDEYSFNFDLKAAPQLEKAVDIGYEIHLSDPRSKEIMCGQVGYSLVNGFATILKTRLIKTSRIALFTPWHGMSTRCPRLPADLDVMGHGERYYKSACQKWYSDKLMRDKCGCQFILDHSNTTLRQCDPVDVYGCFIRAALHDNLTGMAEQCVHPCLEYEYESEASFVKIGGENISRLVFFYAGMQYSLLEYRTSTISSLLSQIGGALGLYVGASIITAVELVSFLVSWVWYRFLPHKRVQTADASTISRRQKKAKELYYF